MTDEPSTDYESVEPQILGGQLIPACLAIPAVPNGAGIVLGMSVWGLNADLRAYAALLAGLGYMVLAPNLFWREQPDHAVDYDFARLEAIARLMDRTTDEEAGSLLADAGDALRRRGCGPIGIVGWCYGGRIGCVAAMRADVDAVVAFYPTALETRLDIAGRLHAPLSVHLPEHEQFATTEDAISRIIAAAAKDPMIEAHVYPGAWHGFGFRPPHPHFHEPAQRLSELRAEIFLDRHLAAHARGDGGTRA